MLQSNRGGGDVLSSAHALACRAKHATRKTVAQRTAVVQENLARFMCSSGSINRAHWQRVEFLRPVAAVHGVLELFMRAPRSSALRRTWKSRI